MTAKISASRRAAFLKALGETGNQQLSAERAKVSRSWVTAQRARDAGFDAAVREAVEAARAALGTRPSTLRLRSGEPSLGTSGGEAPAACGGNKPPRGWVYLEGVELVVRGTGDGIGPSTGSGQAPRRRVQIARARLKQWDARTEDRFLDALAASCNIRAACAAVGLTAASAYKHRDRWPGFARRWDKAVEIASERLECGLLQAGHNLFSSPEDRLPADVPITEMTAEHAMLLLRLHRQGVKGGRRAPGRPPLVATNAEVRAALIKALEEFRREEARREARGSGGSGGRHGVNP